ncbi:family 2B encapsulin nanocompartment shell protein [Flindersiella endophytica]
MTATESAETTAPANGQAAQLSLSTTAARKLATTTKTVPQMQGISSRWLIKLLPWVNVAGGTYRVNRRLSYAIGDGRVTFISTGADVRVVPAELCELPLLRGFDDIDALEALADRFVQEEYDAGHVIVEQGQPADRVFLIAHGKVNKLGSGHYGDEIAQGVLADGQYFGEQALGSSDGTWDWTVRAATPCTVLVLPSQSLQELNGSADPLREHIQQRLSSPAQAQNEFGEAEIGMSAGHEGEADLPGTFVDYDTEPREYQLSVAQTVLRVHSRVADLFNQPMDQVEQQLRLTIEALRERQENELVNNREFGLLHNADLSNRIHTRGGPPTPDDLDELISVVWKEPTFFLAHPRAIAAFGRECTRRGIYPTSVDVNGHQLPAWRGIPIFPCNKIPVSDTSTSSIMLMRTGEERQGVVGLHQVGIPDEYQPGLNVRFMNINEKAIMSYLVSLYYSAAVLVPDALGVLENVELGKE